MAAAYAHQPNILLDAFDRCVDDIRRGRGDAAPLWNEVGTLGQQVACDRVKKVIKACSAMWQSSPAATVIAAQATVEALLAGELREVAVDGVRAEVVEIMMDYRQCGVCDCNVPPGASQLPVM